MSRSGYWQDLTTVELAQFDAATTVAVLPVGAIEQHGPHLPLSTDAVICRGIAAAALEHGCAQATMLVLPAIDLGHSPEHTSFPGTVHVDAGTLLDVWMSVGRGVRSAGFDKLVILNAHGGQRPLLDIAAVNLRVQHALNVARANYFHFGMPDGLFEKDEVHMGIHGGEVETSLMLHLAPELVRRERLEDFRYADERRARNETLSYNRPAGLAWLSEDLNEHGVVGNAARADAQRGRKYLEFLGERLAAVCDEMLL